MRKDLTRRERIDRYAGQVGAACILLREAAKEALFLELTPETVETGRVAYEKAAIFLRKVSIEEVNINERDS